MTNLPGPLSHILRKEGQACDALIGWILWLDTLDLCNRSDIEHSVTPLLKAAGWE